MMLKRIFLVIFIFLIGKISSQQDTSKTIVCSFGTGAQFFGKANQSTNSDSKIEYNAIAPHAFLRFALKNKRSNMFCVTFDISNVSGKGYSVEYARIRTTIINSGTFEIL